MFFFNRSKTKQKIFHFYSFNLLLNGKYNEYKGMKVFFCCQLTGISFFNGELKVENGKFLIQN
jgi:hypothetical protein